MVKNAIIFIWIHVLIHASIAFHPIPACKSSQIKLNLSPNLDKGFNILENASKIIPQGQIVNTAKESWKFVWKRMMTELAPQDKSGNYNRPLYTFDGKIGDERFPMEIGRYHLYGGNPCPWCHRTTLALTLNNLTKDIGYTKLIDDPIKASRGGWIFAKPNSRQNQSVDPLKTNDLRELYDLLSPNYKGRCTAPLLVDLKTKQIVSNESSDIVRMFNKNSDFYPKHLSKQIDDINAWTYDLLNNGVYRCGFSTTQSAYDKASNDVRLGLQKCNDLLKDQMYLCGSKFTEADIRLLPTMLRFDGVYAPLFRAGGSHLRVRDYPYLHAWLKRCWNDIPGIKDTIDLEDANASYYKQLFPLNPGGLIPTKITAKDIGLE